MVKQWENKHTTTKTLRITECPWNSLGALFKVNMRLQWGGGAGVYTGCQQAFSLLRTGDILALSCLNSHRRSAARQHNHHTILLSHLLPFCFSLPLIFSFLRVHYSSTRYKAYRQVFENQRRVKILIQLACEMPCSICVMRFLWMLLWVKKWNQFGHICYRVKGADPLHTSLCLPWATGFVWW